MTHPAPSPCAAETDLVELVDPDGTPIGTAPRREVHTAETPLHRAYSLYLFNARGQVLMTRRALGKRTWPGVWTNACCGHPRPGEPTVEALRRRTAEELGAVVRCEEVALPDFAYRAVDASGIAENEICPVFLGAVVDDRIEPDPDEVMDHRWMDWHRVVAGVRATPEMFSPWAAQQILQLDEQLPAWSRRPGGATGAGTADATLEAVDALLVREGGALQEAWAESIPDPTADVLGEDLPRWLDGLLRTGGKRIRPMMCHWGFVAAGGRVGAGQFADLVRVAAALEALHVFALIHDDVMDESDTRRGQPAAHVRAEDAHRRSGGHGDPATFGRNVAILLGDLAHSEADRLVSTLPEVLRAAWFTMCTELIAGQRADITGAAASRRDLAHARLVARLKSGAYTVERPLLFGAAAAQATAKVRAPLARYGQAVGEAFALRDDLLGIWGDPKLTGKPAGDDLRHGKATVILGLARERLRGSAAVALARLGTATARDEDVPMLMEALAEAGVRDEVERLVADAYHRALTALDGADLDPDGVGGLRRIARTIAWRDR